jgi:hypothetical protein
MLSGGIWYIKWANGIRSVESEDLARGSAVGKVYGIGGLWCYGAAMRSGVKYEEWSRSVLSVGKACIECGAYGI